MFETASPPGRGEDSGCPAAAQPLGNGLGRAGLHLAVPFEVPGPIVDVTRSPEMATDFGGFLFSFLGKSRGQSQNEMNKRPEEALNFVFECLETREVSKHLFLRKLRAKAIHWISLWIP